MREAVLIYKRSEEFEDNVTLAASAGYTFAFQSITPEDTTDVLLGYKLTVHQDSDDVRDLPPYSADIMLTASGGLGQPYGDGTVTWGLSSYSGTPGTHFIHATLTAIYAVTE